MSFWKTGIELRRGMRRGVPMHGMAFYVRAEWNGMAYSWCCSVGVSISYELLFELDFLNHMLPRC